MREIASVNRFQLYEDGARLVFTQSRRPNSKKTVGGTMFSVGLFGVFDLVWMFRQATPTDVWVTVLMWGGLTVVGLAVLVLGVVEDRGKPFGGRGLAVIDRASCWVLDGSLAPVCPLSHARVGYLGRHITHINTLAISHPGGSLLIAQGTFWSPSVAEFAAALQACGVPISPE